MEPLYVSVDMIRALFKSSQKDENCKYFVVPDIHGRYSVFNRVDRYIRENCEKERKIIFLGDYFDRGEDGEVFGKEFSDAGTYYTFKALLLFKQWAEKEGREVYFLRGNHEIFFEDYFLKGSPKPYQKYHFFRNSVDSFEFAFRNDDTLFKKLENFLRELIPYYLDKKNRYLFVHAGVDFRVGTIEDQAKDGLIYWIREKFIYDTKRLPYTVVFGHTPFADPFIKVDRIGLDSGVYHSGFINLLKIDGQDSRVIKI